MSRVSQAEYEMRGSNEEYAGDYHGEVAGGRGSGQFARKFPRAPSTEELRRRGFVSKPVSARCWCGRPVKDSTGQCLRKHRPPEVPGAPTT